MLPSHLGHCGDVIGEGVEGSCEGQRRPVLLVRLQVKLNMGGTHLSQQLPHRLHHSTGVHLVYEGAITLTLHPEW